MNTLRRYYGHVDKVPEISHDELVQRAFTYTKFNLGCSVVFKERITSTRENPDVIGFRGGFSYLIECKSTRTDFFADKKKSFRINTQKGMGGKRYFMAPVGMLEPKEIPIGWGLLEVYEKPPGLRNRTVKIAKESDNFNERNLAAEVQYLISAIRRLEISMAVFVEPFNFQKDELVP